MAFDNLSDRLQMTLRRVTGRGRLTEKDIEEMMREIRLGLLEADVNFRVVKSFTKNIKEQALGERILKGLNPGQQVVKLVSDELQKVMGDKAEPLVINPSGITRYMMVGLQGAGKTTTAGKLALHMIKKNNMKPLLVALDIYRPAAVEQLKTVASQVGADIFEMGTSEPPLTIIKKAMEFAKENGNDIVIADTAGRLQIDEGMMNELVEIEEFLQPDEILLTLDAMTGQESVNVTNGFNETLNITGAILTKLDGDTRGGAALSIRQVTNIPIKLMGLGEKLDQLEVFHPERMASRILGMGDVMTLVDKVTDNIDESDMMGMMEKMMSGKFNYDDYRKQLKMIKRMGSLGGIMKLIPGVGKMMKGVDVDDKQTVFIDAIISSMTKAERKDPNLIATSSSRRKRVASGSGRSVSEVNKLIKTIDQMTSTFKRMSTMDPNQMANMNPTQMMNTMNQPQKKAKAGNKKKRWRY